MTMTEGRELMTLEETMSLGTVLVKSGYFKDARDASQAVVKVLAGREMGFGPIASMQGINIIQGQPSIGANLLGAAVKRTNKYNYRVVHLDNDRAELAFFENGQEVGRSTFSMDDAQRAGLNTKQNWKQWPRNMLFSRALSNGTRWYCPDVFGGVTPYTPEELGAEVDAEGQVIDVTPQPVTNGPAWTPETTAAGEDGGPEPTESDAPEPISSPQSLLRAVNQATNDYYQNPAHMLNAYRKDTGEGDFSWPVDNPEMYAVMFTVLCEHAEAQTAK
jgi:hypothetical protein